MKIYPFIIAMAFLLACNIQDNPEYQKVKTQRDSLLNADSLKNLSLMDFVQSFNDIQENLDEIKEREKIITLKTEKNIEDNIDAATQINDDIRHIYDLMQQNKKELEQLKRRLTSSDAKNKELQKTINRLMQQLEEKDSDIAMLKDKLEKMNIVIDDLTAAVDTLTVKAEEQQNVITEQETKLNTAYYVIGYFKELKEKEIITKEGGFIGIGRIEKLRQDFETDYFTKVNISELTSIDIYTTQARIITNHPAGSYKFVKNDEQVEKLEILDTQAFWSVSKYLVIVVE